VRAAVVPLDQPLVQTLLRLHEYADIEGKWQINHLMKNSGRTRVQPRRNFALIHPFWPWLKDGVGRAKKTQIE
jgi:hypothetical protein